MTRAYPNPGVPIGESLDKQSPQELHLGAANLELLPPRPDLKELIGRSQRMKMEDLKLAGRTAVTNIQEPHVDYWTLAHGQFDMWEGRDDEIRQRDEQLSKMAAQIVLDLGCGIRAPEYERFLEQYKLSAYVGVDIWASFGYRPYVEMHDLGIVMPWGNQENDVLPGALIKGDMLEVISRFPDNSASIILNGIDELILNPHEDYGRALSREITRVLNPAGILFGVTLGGGILEDLSGREGFRAISIPIYPGQRTDYAKFYFLSKND